MTYIFTTYFSKMLDDSSFHFYLKKLPPSMHRSITKLIRWQDRQASLFSKLLLIKGLAKFGLSKEVLNEIKYTKYNKPYIDGNINFNIAHSGNCVICCIGQGNQLGIDVEEIRAIDIQVFSDFINPIELGKILKAKDTTMTFFDYWTKMEAVIKADGRGLNIPLDDIVFNGQQAQLPAKTWFQKKINLRKDYLSHIASNEAIKSKIILENIEFENMEFKKMEKGIPVSSNARLLATAY